jgi:hypothetical protein
MALIATGKTGQIGTPTMAEYDAGGQAESISYTTSRQVYNTDTGQMEWDGGTPPAESITGSYTNDYYNAVQGLANSQSGGTPGMLSEQVALTDPRGQASSMIQGMQDMFYDEGNTASGISLKQDLEAMTTYGGNKGVLGALNASGTKANTTAFDNRFGANGLGGSTARDNSRYGVTLTEEQKQQQQSSANQGRALGSVDVKNRNAQFQNDLNKQVVSGMSSAPKAA